ncbi:hypothetical protein [Sinorhizobium sp. GL28]|uniref:hypothetical protein n=1 Tax=Sinorhizobium sp. GL28 TaxID=1358418 RepID=UPI00071D1DBE|nr:hypothetical protein [Sinorhizobium sp. GL28]KSV87567.1 hypothetical protein N184_30915 [Sinorhizobium sp. GL28]
MKQLFRRTGGQVSKTVTSGRDSVETKLPDLADDHLEGSSAWWQSFLRNGFKPAPPAGETINIVDASVALEVSR